MDRLVGRVTANAAPVADRLVAALGGSGPSDHLVEGDLALAWIESPTLAVTRSDGVICAVAGGLRLDDAPAEDHASRAAAAAAAYARTGDAVLERLRGTFALLLWDVHEERGVLAVDQLGVRSVVFQRSDGGLLFSLELTDILRLLDRRPSPNDRAVVQWLADGTAERDETLFAGIERLAGGHQIQLRRGSSVKRPYWRFEYSPPAQEAREELEHLLRDSVRRAVGAHVTATASPGVLLSGGLDSAVVAATANELRPGGVRAYSLTFPQHPQVDEEALIEELAAELGIESRRTPFGGGGILHASLEYLREWSTPTVSPNLAVQRPLLERAASDGATTLLDGQGGDELFGSSLYLLADLLRSGRFLRARDLSVRIPGFPAELRRHVSRRALYEYGLKGVLPHGVHVLSRRIRRARHTPAPPWLSPSSARTYGASSDRWRWQQADGPRWWAYLMDELTAQRERTGAHDYLRRRNAMAGVSGAHPFLQDLDLILLLLRLPPELAFDARFDRPLLRSAMAGVVPDRVLRRSEKSYFTPLFLEAMGEHDAPEIRALLTAKDAEIRAYVRADVIRERLLDAPSAQRGGAWAWALWRLVTLECWLRSEAGGARM